MKTCSVILLCILAFNIAVLLNEPKNGVYAASFSSLFQVIKPRTVSKISIVSRDCLMCRFLVSILNYSVMSKNGPEQIHKIGTTFCVSAKIETPDVCDKVVNLFKYELAKVLSKAVLTPDQICGAISGNKCGHFKNPLEEWEVNLSASLELDQNDIQKLLSEHNNSSFSNDASNQQKYRVIHISDTHVDREYQAGSSAVCAEPLCCRKTSSPDARTYQIMSSQTASVETLSLTTKMSKTAGYWGSYGTCDIPLRTFKSSLKHINKTITDTNDVAYIIWTGDIQPHDVWKQTQKGALELYHKIFTLIYEYLPNVKIYPTLGNHEMVPVDSFSPSSMLKIAGNDSPQWLYNAMIEYWDKWLPSETTKTITVDGFYATKVKPNLKLVSLNTNFCHSTNLWLYINSTDPGNQLQWLIHELQISEFLDEKVHIIGHIPPGSDDCLEQWSKNFNKIIRRFKNTVTGQFYGHTHNGAFEIFHELPLNNLPSTTATQQEFAFPEPVSVDFIAPSTTTFVGVNPGFRVFTIDPKQNYTPTDFETHYMNLTQANLQSQRPDGTIDFTVEPTWTNRGSFCKSFDIPNLSPKTLQKLMQDILVEDIVTQRIEPFNYSAINTNNSANKLFELYRLYYSDSDLLTREYFDNLAKKDKRKFICKYLTSQSKSSTCS